MTIEQLGHFLTFAALLVCAALAAPSFASAGEIEVEAAIRAMLPTPFRCSRTTEPAIYCRHDAAGRALVLELASSPAGPSASLTHDYDDAGRHEYFSAMRGFFIRLGVPADALDECVAQSQWQPKRQSGSGVQISCHHTELGDRVTREIFAVIADDAPSALLARADKAIE